MVLRMTTRGLLTTATKTPVALAAALGFQDLTCQLALWQAPPTAAPLKMKCICMKCRRPCIWQCIIGKKFDRSCYCIIFFRNFFLCMHFFFLHIILLLHFSPSGNFFHRKLGSLFPWKATCDEVALSSCIINIYEISSTFCHSSILSTSMLSLITA